MKYFFSSIPKNILKCFTGRNWLWHIAAMALTFILVATNTDWHYFIFMHSLKIRYLFFPALILGGLLPMLAPLDLVVSGSIQNKQKQAAIGWALGQAALIGSLVSSFYKAFTGRIQPNVHDIVHNISHNFNFGFLRHGMFWGWPSSHTTIAFAMAVTLIKMYDKNKAVKILSILYALYIGFGVSFSIHWFSEFAAGAIIGSVIGTAAANSYKSKFEEPETAVVA
jgi:membrane-associated phospholipid phosphatase